MLLQFSVTNHRSIKDTAIISLKASTDKSLSDCLISPDEKKQLVPVLALYGANAAGKSNVLHALLKILTVSFDVGLHLLHFRHHRDNFLGVDAPEFLCEERCGAHHEYNRKG